MSLLWFFVFFLLNFERKSLAWAPSRLQPLDRSLSLPMLLKQPCCNASPLRPLDILSNLHGEARYQNDRFGKRTDDHISTKIRNDAENRVKNTALLLKDIFELSNENVNKKESSPKFEVESKSDKNEKQGDNKALKCSQLQCVEEDTKGPVCACNFKTGNTVSFKNECDIKKHNCRFDTEFKTILHEICPWQFESRSGLDDDADEELIK